jgi:hypothetical protein
MLEVPAEHLLNQGFMPIAQSGQLACPSDRFGVMGVALSVFRQNRPNSVQLPVLAQ